MTNHGPISEISDSTSSSLIQRVVARDQDAWKRLTHLYTPLVYSWCRKHGVQAYDASDIVQEVFRGVHQAIDGFRGDRPGDTFRGWLWAITRNKIRDHYRDRADQVIASGGSKAQLMLREVPDDEPAAELTSDAAGDSHSLLMPVLELVRAEFEEKTWRAFWRSAVDGAETSDIADELGIRPSTVRTAKSRVLIRLREKLKDLFD